jgi:hypothetical protein
VRARRDAGRHPEAGSTRACAAPKIRPIQGRRRVGRCEELVEPRPRAREVGVLLQALSGVVTIGLLVLSAVVGVRLVRRGRADGDRAVAALGLYLLLHGALATGLSVATYVGWSSPDLALPDAATRVLNGGFFGASTLGLACLLHFTQRTFRPSAPAARSLAAGLTLLMAVSTVVTGATEGFAVPILPGPAYWAHFAARVACWSWVAFESFAYWSRLRKRRALGLAVDPIVANRFLLWGLWGLLIALLAFSDPVARFWYFAVADTTTAWVPELGRPIIDATIPVACGLNAAALVLMVLTFFPIPAYRRWIEARHAGRATS